MRKLEGIVKEVVDELEYLKKREERFQSTNRKRLLILLVFYLISSYSTSLDQPACAELRVVHSLRPHRARGLANLPLASILQAKISH